MRLPASMCFTGRLSMVWWPTVGCGEPPAWTSSPLSLNSERFTKPGTPVFEGFWPVLSAAQATGDSADQVVPSGAKVPSAASAARLGIRPSAASAAAVR